ncbi:hypothetical protein [Anaerosporobacter sp.]|uniref:hypothetical protein n=1 Tax=Anaerosporobacter sp. TaxID=1872529 RepID=UPI0028A10CCA|nr:hypothetical protein [Anaerosporobacter sp.]
MYTPRSTRGVTLSFLSYGTAAKKRMEGNESFAGCSKGSKLVKAGSEYFSI